MKTLLVTNGRSALSAFAGRPKSGVEVVPVDMYSLATTSLTPYRALLLGTHVDQYELKRMQNRLEDYLSGGGIIVYCGHVVHPFLHMLTLFRVVPDFTLEDLKVALDASHAIFRGVEPNDVTFRRGVAGFFGRGANPPPRGARVVATLAKGTVPIDWEIPVGAGMLYVHAGSDLWGYLNTGDASARRIPLQLLEWIESLAGEHT